MMDFSKWSIDDLRNTAAGVQYDLNWIVEGLKDNVHAGEFTERILSVREFLNDLVTAYAERTGLPIDFAQYAIERFAAAGGGRPGTVAPTDGGDGE
jgi:hypothetical protein